MKNISIPYKRGARPGLLLGAFFAAGLLLVVVLQTVSAQPAAPAPPILNQSSKNVDRTEGEPGDLLTYQILVTNSGTSTASAVVVTDSLPTGLIYVADSLTVTGGGVAGSTGNTITWTGAISEGNQVKLSFLAMVDESVLTGTEIVNTAIISTGGVAFTRVATTTIISPDIHMLFLPFTRKSFPEPPVVSLVNIGRPNADNQFTLYWVVPDDTYIDHYEIQESDSRDLANASIIATTEDLQYTVGKEATQDNVFYYRVRAVGPGGVGAWSNVLSVVGAYRAEFDRLAPWRIIRQDYDDIDNHLYVDNGHLVLEIDGRWDYAIASPVRPAPAAPYRIETRVFLNEPGNLNAYGIIFGANWDGSGNCPEDNFSGCFNHYYRLLFVWNGTSNRLKLNLKRIDFHDDNNIGRGDATLVDFQEVKVNSPSEGYQHWAVEVYPDGRIVIFANGNEVARANDVSYVAAPYFGVFAATDEYLGAEPHFDWLRVTPINP